MEIQTAWTNPLMGGLVAGTLMGCGDGASGIGEQSVAASQALKEVPVRPNILFMLADDLGFSDIHAFGGEIATPNLDALVEEGRILINHHSGTVSAIARSMLISGTDHHLVGEGTMGRANDERAGLPGYEGFLNDAALSFAELLADAGYHTYMTGKWHLGAGVCSTPSTGGKSPERWGFERSFALLSGGAANHFGHSAATSCEYLEDGQIVHVGQPGQPGGVGGAPEVFYSTDFFTDRLIQYIDSNQGDGKPFFAYAAYTSPHWPLQVPEPWLSMYAGKYDQGYDPVRAARLERIRELRLLPQLQEPSTAAPENLTRSPASPANATASALYINANHGPEQGYVDYHIGAVNKRWESLTELERKAQARYMEIYAGMVSNLDYNIGRLIQHLKDIGSYDNTFILFHSDNGAEGWPLDSGADPKTTDETNASPGIYETLGTDNGKAAARKLQYGLRWAEVSATPFAQWKSFQGEGGLSTPAIVHLPGQRHGTSPLGQFTHITDDTATFLALAGATLPIEPAPADVDPATGKDRNAGKVVYKGRTVYPVTGISLLPILLGHVHGDRHGDSHDCGYERERGDVHDCGQGHERRDGYAHEDCDGSGDWNSHGKRDERAPDCAELPRRNPPFGEESYGRAMIYSLSGHWKARWTEPPFGPGDGHWELFHIACDRGEVHDVSAQHPELLERMYQDWQEYMSRVGGVEPLRPIGFY